jgi:hypothetical protein
MRDTPDALESTFDHVERALISYLGGVGTPSASADSPD